MNLSPVDLQFLYLYMAWEFINVDAQSFMQIGYIYRWPHTVERQLFYILYAWLARSLLNDDVTTWNHFSSYWSFVGESMGHRWIPLSKGQWLGTLIFVKCTSEKRLNKKGSFGWFETLWNSYSATVMRIRLHSLGVHNAKYICSPMGWTAKYQLYRKRLAQSHWTKKHTNPQNQSFI